MSSESHNNIVNGRKGSSERRSRSKPPAEPHEIDEPETLEQRVNKINKENNDQQQKNGRGAPKTLDKVLDLHLYFYQRDSEFLNELSLVWNRQQVVSMFYFHSSFNQMQILSQQMGVCKYTLN